MSYRTFVNNTQIFGNNDYFVKWIEFIKTQGINVDSEGNYDGYILDVGKAVEVLEDISYDLRLEAEKQGKAFYDLTKTFQFYTADKENGGGILDACFAVAQYSYLFLPYSFVDACGDDVDGCLQCSDSRSFYTCRIKEGHSIHVHAS